jgi:hypothetical protein
MIQEIYIVSSIISYIFILAVNHLLSEKNLFSDIYLAFVPIVHIVISIYAIYMAMWFIIDILIYYFRGVE